MEGKVALITGGSRGIGYAIGRALAAEGWRVVLVARSAENLRRAVRTLRGEQGVEGERVSTTAADVTREEEVRDVVRRTAAEFGRIDLVVNGAGILRRGSIAQTALSEWEESLAVNLTGVFLLSREAVRVMLEQEPDEEALRGRLIQIVSGAGVHGWPGHGSYSAAKHGVMGLSATLREEVRTEGIQVSDVLPGMVDTDMTDQDDFAGRPKLEPDDVARAVLAAARTPGHAVVTRVDVRHRLPR